MKRIAEVLWNEPVIAAAVVNAALAVLAGEGIVSEWIVALSIAVSAPIVRRFTVPEKRVVRPLNFHFEEGRLRRADKNIRKQYEGTE